MKCVTLKLLLAGFGGIFLGVHLSRLEQMLREQSGVAASRIQDKAPNPVVVPTSKEESAPAFTLPDIVRKLVPLSQCEPVTDQEKANLRAEIGHYEKSVKFTKKIQEVQETRGIDAHHKAIGQYLKDNVLRPGWSILELGCAAGFMLQYVKRAYSEEAAWNEESAWNDGTTTEAQKEVFVGVELVTGWVNFAKEHFKGTGVDIYEGDITEFTLPEPYAGKTFDFVMLNDVAEHIQKNRYGCFFQNLKRVTHDGSIVYMHTPTPQAQIVDTHQYLENVLPHHFVIAGMANINFDLVHFELDVDTVCRRASLHNSANVPSSVLKGKCTMGGWVKYYHMVFRRVDKQPIFDLH